ncbi:MAG TPA: hypothetical protein VFC63_26885 [Blastocatellia bacterium]|nr:hypothetical protein [Blastocatellia bacterium]
MRRVFVALLFISVCGLMASTTLAQTAGSNDHRIVKTAPKNGVRVNAISSSALDDPPTTDADGTHASFTGGVIDRGNPLFDGLFTITENIVFANATNTVGTVSGVITIGSGKGDKQATVVIEYKGQIRKNVLAGNWKVSGATGVAEGIKGTGTFSGTQSRKNLFLTLMGAVAKP